MCIHKTRKDGQVVHQKKPNVRIYVELKDVPLLGINLENNKNT
eukprot:UN07201